MRRISLTLSLAVLAGCGESVTGGAAASLCATSQGVEVCAGRAEYSPNDNLTATITNTTAETIFVDGCSIKVVGKTSRTASFETDYSPTVQCGTDVDTDEILANMVEVAPGQSVEMMIRIPPFAFQGFYRVNVWVLDATGERVASLPTFSGTFEVFPSAGS